MTSRNIVLVSFEYLAYRRIAMHFLEIYTLLINVIRTGPLTFDDLLILFQCVNVNFYHIIYSLLFSFCLY